MSTNMKFSVLNWNIGGAKYLELSKDPVPGKSMGREEFRTRLNAALQNLIDRHHPHVVTLQESVRYGPSPSRAKDIVETPAGYRYYSFPLIDTDRLSARRKWDEVRRAGKWPENTYFAQGNAFMFRDELLHFPVWALPRLGLPPPRREGHFIEQVGLESGLYFGERSTEPRAALVAHFVFDVQKDDRPLDIFVVNTHLTTLWMEREGIPEVDTLASSIRLQRLETRPISGTGSAAS
jgi:hypothetical protein